MHLLTIVLPSALATANRITEPGSASDSAHSRHGARRSKASNERLEEPRPPARATMKNYFTHSGKQESREVTITDLDMGTFDYFCNPSIFGKNAGAGQCSKRLASAAGGLPLYLWEKCRGRAVQQKIGECYRWGATPLSLAKMQGQGSAVKNWRALPLGGYPSSLGKMQGQGSAAKNWRALPLGGYPAIFGKNAGARQCSKKLASATAGGLPLIFGKNAGARQCNKIVERCWGATPLSCRCSKNLASATAGGRPLYLWENHGSPNPYENPIG